ncbi:MAG TPA: sigma-54 dependent transcriptional regulator [Polyangiaceae bacterium]
MEQSCEPQHCSVCGLIPVAPRLRGGTRIVAVSPSMQALLKRVARFADSDAPVAVLGETGTGKEVIARILHANCARSKRPFVAVNVAALPAELLESELFGHGRGAFTGAGPARQGLFEAAHGGTLFLDEIAEMPLALQVKLLRVLQDGEVRRVGESSAFAVDVRIVCATHRDPAEQVRQGLFREDLYYRLKVLTLRVPPLRSRKTDILPLAHHFLKQEKPGLTGFSPEVKARFMVYAWPGNVRELQNVVKHGAALAMGDEVCEADLPEEITSSSPESLCDPPPPPPPGLRTLASMEREHILQVLDACQGSQARAASVLGIARNTLWRKLRSFA